LLLGCRAHIHNTATVAASLPGAHSQHRYGCCVAHFGSIFATPLRLLRRSQNILQGINTVFVRSLNPNAAYAKCSLQNNKSSLCEVRPSLLAPNGAYTKCSAYNNFAFI